MEFADRTLTCRICEKRFVFSAEEQQFFKLKGFVNDPRRLAQSPNDGLPLLLGRR